AGRVERDPGRPRLHSAVVRVPRPRGRARRTRSEGCRTLRADAPRAAGVRGPGAHAVPRDRRPGPTPGRRPTAAHVRVRRTGVEQARDARLEGGTRRQGLLPGVPARSERERRRGLARPERMRLLRPLLVAAAMAAFAATVASLGTASPAACSPGGK